MKKGVFFALLLLLFSTLLSGFSLLRKFQPDEELFLTYIANPKTQDIKLFWKDDKGQNFGNFQNLKTFLDSNKQTLLFAMNGGMYKEDGAPLGLFIENKKTRSRLNTANGNGNFYLKPNGIFYITETNDPFICKTEDFPKNESIKYATQ